MPALIALLALILTACSVTPGSTSTAAPQEVIYRRDMMLRVDGILYEGVAVIPAKDAYQFHVQAQGDLDLFTFETCHREEVTERAWNVEGEERWFLFKRRVDKKREVKFEYRPTVIEKSNCAIVLGGYAQKDGRHSWAFLDVQDNQATLAAELSCNGAQGPKYGVSVCQSKHGLIQQIKFAQKVKVSPDAGCELSATEGDVFEFAMPRGECVYAFKSPDGKVHRLTTIGYDQVKIRN